MLTEGFAIFKALHLGYLVKFPGHQGEGQGGCEVCVLQMRSLRLGETGPNRDQAVSHLQNGCLRQNSDPQRCPPPQP